MYKRRLNSLNRLLAVVLSGAVLLSAGCGAGKTNDATGTTQNTDDGGMKASEEGSGDEASADETKGSGEKGAGDSGSDSEGAENSDGKSGESSEGALQLSEEELNSPIDYVYQSHPLTLMNGDTKYAMANYYTFELDKSVKDKFSKLQKVLDEYGENGEKAADEFFTSSADEIKEMFDSGWGLAYESDRFMYPVRADGRVFSFVVERYTYLAGAHGYTDYANFNYDPATGEEIQFTDVVKNTDNLGEIIASEIEKNNEDIARSFADMPSDRESLVEGIPDRLKENAAGLSWAIDYDGMWCYFEDYAMGYYALGSQAVKLLFADYPDVFTDKYNNYKDTEVPNISEIGRELKEAENVTVDAAPMLGKSAGGADEDGYGEDWWYHAVVKNPGWSAWTSDGIDTSAGEPSYKLSEVNHNSSDWLDEDKWAKENGIPLPERFPYSDGTYEYSVVNNADGGEMSLTVYNKELSSLEGNYYFDEFLNPPDQGDGLFSDFTEPAIEYALVKDNTLYVALGHRTYAAANPHKSYIVAIDMVSGQTLWKSDDQVCGSHNFVILGDSIYCGYGFTDEPDYIYILNCNNGKVQDKIKVKSAPYYFIVQEEYLYVLTYNTEYLYKLVE